MRDFHWDQAMEAPSEAFRTRVRSTLSALPEQEETVMKKWNLKRTAVLAAAAMAVLAVSAAATGGFGMISTHCNKLTDTLPTIQTVSDTIADIESIDDHTDVPEAFSNGFVFDSTIREHNIATEKESPEEIKYDSISITYLRDGAEVTYHLTPDHGWGLTDSGETVTVGDVELYTLVQQYKFVNVGYEKTEAEKAAEAAGELQFSFTNGLEEPLCLEQRYVGWVMNGTEYALFCMDSLTTMDELVEMAEELIGE